MGHTGFLLDGKIMGAVLYHFLNDEDFRNTVKEEHRVLSGLFDQYLANLRDVYADEIEDSSSGH